MHLHSVHSPPASSGPERNGHKPSDAALRNDEEVIEKARSERGGKFERLWNGDLADYGGDHSRADDAFVHKLYSYTQDSEQLKRIHARSGLHRLQKSGRRADYLQRSISRAAENVSWFYEWSVGAKPVGHGGTSATATKDQRPASLSLKGMGRRDARYRRWCGWLRWKSRGRVGTW